ncbi:MAG: serine--tRNA ligase, partial [Candidatus Aenigmatarchaeota archaeon]
MLDIKQIRENLKDVEENLSRRKDPEVMKRLKELVAADSSMRNTIKKVEKLKHEKNVVTREIAATRDKSEKKKKIGRMRSIGSEIEELDKKREQLEKNVKTLLMGLPNLLHESVPYGEGEEGNVKEREWGKKPEFGFKPLDHIDLAVPRGMIDIERAAKISGARFFFLKGEAALLDFALMHYAMDFMHQR